MHNSLAQPPDQSNNFVINQRFAVINRSPRASESPKLGNIAQSSSQPTLTGKNHYQSVTPELEADKIKRLAKHRFALHRLQARLLPDEKALASCSLHAAPHTGWIEGKFIKSTESAYFGGLKHCDSPNCILCAPRRAEEAKQELTVALAQAERQGLFVYHIIPTMSHGWLDSLAAEHDSMNRALQAVFSGRWFDEFISDVGYVGRVRAYEPPFGENGWHLHAHVVLFLKYPPLPERLEAELFARYSKMLAKQNRHADQAHGLRVEVGYSSLAEYVAKYGHDPVLSESGLETELTEFRLKTGKKNSLTPFELLAAANGDSMPLSKLADVCRGRGYSEAQLLQLAAELFIEYFETFKGKPRLVWSKGLRAALDMETAMDWYASEHPEPESVPLILLDPQVGWKQVRGDGSAAADLRADLLAILRTGDVVQVKAWARRHHIEAAWPGEYEQPRIRPKPPGDGWSFISSSSEELIF